MTRHLFLLIVVALIAISGCSTGPKVEFVPGDSRIDVLIAGKHFTSYRYEDTLTKPVLYPLRTPSGVVVNRSYPLAEVPGESTDHPHHTGVFFTYDMVNDDGFWNNSTTPPQIKHAKIKKMHPGAGKGTLSTIMHWTGKSGDVLLEESRTMVFIAGPNEYAIDFTMDLKAVNNKVVFGDTKEGMFAIRVAKWLKEKGGNGVYLSSDGDELARNIWGKQARWVTLQGEKDGQAIGIAIFHHPESVNYPTYWHARNYGLFSANPLGQYEFEENKNPETAKKRYLTLETGDSARFRFLMLFYEGDRTMQQLETTFKTFAN
jgi:hypothetical protein